MREIQLESMDVTGNHSICKAIPKTLLDAIVVINCEGIIQSLNGAIEKITGYSPDELAGKNINVLMTMQDKVLHSSHIERYLDTGQAAIIGVGRSVEVQQKSGKTLMCDLSISEFHNQGEVYFAGILRDISERVLQDVLIERQLNGSHILNQLAAEKIESIDLGLQRAITMATGYYGLEFGSVCKIDNGNYYIVASNMNEAMLDQLKNELALGETFYHLVAMQQQLIAEDYVDRSDYSNYKILGFEACISAPVYRDHKLWGVLSFGSQKYFDRSFDRADKQWMGLISQWISNVLEREYVNEQIKLSEERLSQSQTFANIGTWDWDIQTGELFWTDRISPLFGYAKGELETSYDNFIKAVHPDDRERLQKAVDACVYDNKKYEIEHRVVWPDGTIRWLLERGDVIRDKHGKPLRMLGVVQDIQRAKKAEQSAQLARLQAEQANRAKSEFLSSMSHELRTPMTSILGFSQLLELEESLTEEQQSYAEFISHSGNHLLNLINEVLDLAKIESGKIGITIKPVNVNKQILESITFVKGMAAKKNIAITYVPPKHNLLIYADEMRLKQVLINLLSNAVKYNKENGWIKLMIEATPNNKLRICIADSGKGIPDKLKQDVFVIFNRLGMEATAIEGTGIGLTLSRQLIQNMGGDLNFTSEEGIGSCFWCELPSVSSSLVIADDERNKTVKIERRLSLHQAKKVLYVEDNPTNIVLMKKILSSAYRTQLLIATTAETGLEIALNEIPDLILMDINLPGTSGIEAIKKIRAIDKLLTVPVIAVSANAMPESINLAMEAGFNEYVTKPFDVHNIIELIERFSKKSIAMD